MVRHNGSHSEYLSAWQLGMVIASLLMGTFLIALDCNIVSVAIPKIAAEFNALQNISWFGAAYLLTITAFQPILGVIYRFAKVELTYKTCVLLFEAGTVVCAAATNARMFIVGRAIAGVGAAGLLQGALCVIGHVVILEKRSMYMGIVISVFIVSVCIGPVLGGVLTTHATWRWCFWINLPFGAIALCLLSFYLRIDDDGNPERKLPLREKLSRLEPAGCLTFLGAVTCLLLALQWGGQSLSWDSATVVGLLVGSVALIIVFGYIQFIRGEKAMIPLRVLRQRSVWTSAVVLFLFGANTYPMIFYLPFYYQMVQGVDAITSGIRLLPLMVPEVAAVILAGVIVSRIGHYVPVMLIGSAVCAVGSGFLIALDIHTGKLTLALCLVVTGLGIGTTMQLPYTALQTALPPQDLPVANAIAVFSSQLGGAMGIAAGQAITLNILIAKGRELLPQVPIQMVALTGVTGIHSSNFPPEVVTVLRSIWSYAISRVFALTLAALLLSIPFTCAMEWLNTKKVAETRRIESTLKVVEESARSSSETVEKQSSSVDIV